MLLPPSPHRLPQQSPTAQRAFSLVEAVISIGVVCFAMMGILGMVPVGLSTFRDAMQLTVESSIVQEVAGELQRTDYDNLAATNLYFDEQGLRVSSPHDATCQYSAVVLPPRPLDASFLVAATAGRTMTVEIHNRAEPAVVTRQSVIIPRSH